MRDLILVCGDAFGVEILDCIETSERWLASRRLPPRYRVIGYVSDAPAPFGRISCKLARLGNPDSIEPEGDVRFVLAIRDPAAKKTAVERIRARGGRFETIISPYMLAPKLEIGEGAVVDAYSIASGVRIGAYATICGSMLSDGDVGDYATIMRFANVIGDGVGEGAYVGNHAFVPHGKTVGDWARVGDGAIVVRSVKPGAVVGGIPARKMRTEN